MKKLIIIGFVLFFGVLGKAQSNQDSLVINQITKEVVEKLSNDELIQLIKEMEAMKYNSSIAFGENQANFLGQQFVNPDFVKSVIISLIISMLLFIILLISLPFYFNLKKTKSFHKMINGFTEKGQEIPKELILSVSQTKSDLHKSIILISTGIAVLLALIVLSNHGRIWAIGIIPIIIGIGYFIASRTVK